MSARFTNAAEVSKHPVTAAGITSSGRQEEYCTLLERQAFQKDAVLFRSVKTQQRVAVSVTGIISNTGRGEYSFRCSRYTESAPYWAVLHHMRQRATATPTTTSGGLTEIPSVAEAGVPGYDANAWFGLFAPAATPKDIVARLNAEVVKGLQTQDMRERLRALGATPGGGTPEQFAAFFRDEVAKWAKVVKSAGVRVD